MQRVTPPRGMASVGAQVRGGPTHWGTERPYPGFFLTNALPQQGYGAGMRPPPNSLATSQVLSSMNM